MNRLALLEEHGGALSVALAVLLALAALWVLPKKQRRPARTPFVLVGVHLVARGIGLLFSGTSFGSKVVQFIAVFALLAAIARAAFLLFTGSAITRRYLRPWPKILRDVVQALLYFGVALLALRAVGVEPSSLLTTSALLTAVLGLSMQETLGNLFAGLALQGQQSLGIGDWVRFADGPEGLGEVVEINWRSTHFLTNTQVKVVVPNGVIARAIIRNYSLPTRIVRHDVELLAPYDVSPERVRTVILAAVRDSAGVLTEPEASVLVHTFSDSGVTYSLRYFIDDYGQRDPIEGDVRQRILYAFRRAGIEFPFPHRHLLAPGLELAMAGLGPARAQSATPLSDLPGRLARIEAFKSLEPDALGTLSEGSSRHLYAPGEAIVRQGEVGAELFGIERGEVEIVAASPSGPAVRVAVLGPGEIFGEAALLTGEARSATIVALTECEVVAIPRSTFQSVLEANRELAERFTTLLAERMDQLSQTVNDADAGQHLDRGRRSDLLLTRIKSFFSR